MLGAAAINRTTMATGNAHRCTRSIGRSMRSASAGQRVRIATPAASGANTDTSISSAMAQGLATTDA